MQSNLRATKRALSFFLIVMLFTPALVGVVGAYAPNPSGPGVEAVGYDVTNHAYTGTIYAGTTYDFTAFNFVDDSGYGGVGIQMYDPWGIPHGSPRDAYPDPENSGMLAVTFPSVTFSMSGEWFLADTMGGHFAAFWVDEAARADLYISSAWFDPASPAVGDTVTYTIEVFNYGSADAGPFSIAFEHGGTTEYVPLWGLYAGDWITVSTTFTPGSAGYYSYYVTVDVYDEVVEYSEDNSVYSEVYVVGSRPDNDDFANAIVIPSESLTYTHSMDTTGATNEPGEPSACAGIGNAVWYRWTAPADGDVSLVVDTVGSGYDSALAAYTGASVDALSFVACDDDSGGSLTSRIAFAVVGGETYHFQVGGFYGSTGWLQFNFAVREMSDVYVDSVTLSNSNPESGEEVIITAVIGNHGSGDSGAFSVITTNTWSEFARVGNLVAGETVTVTGSWYASHGTTEVVVVADPHRETLDSNWDNNWGAAPVAVVMGPPEIYDHSGSGSPHASFWVYGSNLHGASVCFDDGVSCEPAALYYTSMDYLEGTIPLVPVGPYVLVVTTDAGAVTSDTFTVLGPQSAIIDNGLIQLGVYARGNLGVYDGTSYSGSGTYPTGLRYLPTGNDATAAGCVCEGWGVGDASTGVSGYANVAAGTDGLDVESFTFTDSTAVSVTTVGTTFRVTHDYHPAPETPNLYEVHVTIENIGETPTDTYYRRVMDWDIEPTAFSEYVSIWAEGCADGSGLPANVSYVSNNGFASANPLSGPTNIGYEGCFLDAGPDDHGALFDFRLGVLAPGASVSFSTYYGAGANVDEALNAVTAVEAEIFSLGKPVSSDPSLGAPNTFAFAFRGVGGPPVTTPPGGGHTVPAFAGTLVANLPGEGTNDRFDNAIFGVAPGATSGYDASLDNVEPPAPPTAPWVRMFFGYPENPADVSELHRSMEGAAERIEWPLVVQTRPVDSDFDGIFDPHTVGISWDPSAFVGLGSRYTLLLIDGETIVDMRDFSSYAYLQPGGEEMTARNYVTKTMTIRLDIAKPDLTLEMIGGSMPTWPHEMVPVVGHESILDFRVDNLGAAASTGGSLRLFFGGSEVASTTLPGIPAYGSDVVQLSFTPQYWMAGPQVYRFVVESEPAELSSTLGNNELAGEIFVQQYALHVEMPPWLPAFRAGETQTFDAFVHNHGNVYDDVVLSASSAEGWLVSISTENEVIGPGDGVHVVVTVTAPDTLSAYDEYGWVALHAASFDPFVTAENGLSVVKMPRLQMHLEPGWQLVSVPLVPVDASPAAVFGADAVVFSWAGSGYDTPTEILPGHGYWVYVDAAVTLDLDGGYFNGWGMVDMPVGWKLIGGTTNEASVLSGHGYAPLLYSWPAGSIGYETTFPDSFGNLWVQQSLGYWIFFEEDGAEVYATD